MKYILSICLLSTILLSGCLIAGEVITDANSLNLYQYYIFSDKYAYNNNTQTITTTEIPQFLIDTSQSWQYYSFYHSMTEVENYSHNFLFKIEQSIKNDIYSISKQTLTHNNSTTSTTYDTIRYSDTVITAKKEGTEWVENFDNLYYKKYPLALHSEIENSFIGIIMDDSSIWFRTEKGIYSSKIGKVVMFDWADTSVLLYRDNERVNIGYQLREFLVKESYIAN